MIQNASVHNTHTHSICHTWYFSGNRNCRILDLDLESYVDYKAISTCHRCWGLQTLYSIKLKYKEKTTSSVQISYTLTRPQALHTSKDYINTLLV